MEKSRNAQATSSNGEADNRNTGISNRESAREESAERAAHPPIDAGSPPPEDAAGRSGDEPIDTDRDRQTSRKAGSRSIAQKQADTPYSDRPMPASSKVAGAFGKEPNVEAGESEGE
jgi:hypothetical protein